MFRYSKHILTIVALCITATQAQLPQGFVYIDEVDASIQQSMRYYSAENFVGRKLDGYTTPRAILTQQAATALAAAQAEFKKEGYSIVIYDTYRPQRAVNLFMNWADDRADQLKKASYYPYINKADVFELGYVARRSGHSRGSTVDMTIIAVDKKVAATAKPITRTFNGKEYIYLDDNTIDTGTSFDLFDPLSHHDNNDISAEALKNRNYLRAVMIKHGFKPYNDEWWHYTLTNEPFPDTYFDFIVE
jgi:D-alanyl-D-alanine dipeptidase